MMGPGDVESRVQGTAMMAGCLHLWIQYIDISRYPRFHLAIQKYTITFIKERICCAFCGEAQC
jgi:hypothetical protein